MPTDADANPVERVRAYYERNTPIFLRFGRERETQTIHRSVWAEGVGTLPDALVYVNNLVGRAVTAVAAERAGQPLQLLDLGCGVGGSLFHLARATGAPFYGIGVTISPMQCRLARQSALARGMDGRAGFVEADFLHLPLAGGFDLAYAIESFIHAPDYGLVLGETARVLKPGGVLLVCDDFLVDEPPGNPEWLVAFRRGWHANSALSLSRAIALAQTAGLHLRLKRNLTSDLRLLRLPGFLARLALRIGNALPSRWDFVQGQVGGLGLQYGLASGLIAYHWLEFVKE
ncbi:MAG: methyltransferase domain-containing protein [Thermoflexales bacterium]